MQQYLTHLEKNCHCDFQKIHYNVFLTFQVPKKRLSSQKEHAIMRKSFPRRYPITQPFGVISNLTCRCNIQTWITNHSFC